MLPERLQLALVMYKQKQRSLMMTYKLSWRSRDRYCKDCAGRITPAKKIAAKSSKKAGEDQVYSKLRKDYLTLRPVCKANVPGCTSVATDVHHKAGRGKYYLITTTWLPVCRICHMWIETHPKEAKELGFSENRL